MAKDRENKRATEKDKSLHFFVPGGFHRRLKMVCAYEGQTLKSYIVKALEKALAVSEKSIASGAKPVAENSSASSPATSE